MFAHEELDVYRCALEFAAWSRSIRGRINNLHRSLHEQLIRAEGSIILNIAEGNGKRPGADRRRYLESARGSAAECAAIIDILRINGVVSSSLAAEGKDLLDRIAAMLTKMMR